MSLLVGLRERRERGVLSIALAESRSRVDALEQAAFAMLECVQALVLDIDEIGAPELRASLTELRVRLASGEARHVAEVRVATLEFAAREREHLDRRDAELRRIIRVLTEGLAGISTGAASYHRQILETGTRFEAAARLADLQRVRAAITSEVATLRTAVAQRQRSDSQVTAALRAEVEQLRAKVETVTEAARLDKLTGAANRAAFDDALARCCAADRDVSLLLCDIDHFKSINDTHGHPVGDRVLQALVTFLRDRVRRDDLIARWGGEEFAVLLPGASLRAAFAKARGLTRDLADAEWAIDAAKKLQFTMSVGVATRHKGDEAAALVERADRCLYAAKRGGRNRAMKESFSGA
ncbi:MAG TPA: GGDEF domain-containing protein [Kofleriaceae bacterium]